VKSHLTSDFRSAFNALPERIKQNAKKAYQLWVKDPFHPGLAFKRVGKVSESYSLRVGLGWRALGTKKEGAMVWFWIGSHAEYDRLIKDL
jgi:hypothetical protein